MCVVIQWQWENMSSWMKCLKEIILYREDVCDTTLVTQAYTTTRKIQRLVTLDDKDPWHTKTRRKLQATTRLSFKLQHPWHTKRIRPLCLDTGLTTRLHLFAPLLTWNKNNKQETWDQEHELTYYNWNKNNKQATRTWTSMKHTTKNMKQQDMGHETGNKELDKPRRTRQT